MINYGYSTTYVNKKDISKILKEEATFDQFTGYRAYQLAMAVKVENFEKFFSKMDINGDTALTYIIQNTVEQKLTYDSLVERFKVKPEYKKLLNIQNEHGETPLHSTAISKNEEFCSLLVKGQLVDGSIKDSRNTTALDIATMMEHTKIVELLKQLETSTITDIQPSTYQWGQIFTSSLSLIPNAKASSVLFNDELSSLVQTEFGQNFSLALTDTGQVYSSGLCSYGKTGHKKKRDVLIPTLIIQLSNKRIKSIACGQHHSLALDDIGQVYSWGNGSSGRLGLGDSFSVVSEPTLIPEFGSEIAIGIAAGMDNSMVLCSNGHVFSFGNNLNYKLGYITPNGLGFQSTPKRIENIVAMQQIACSNWHSVFLDRKGLVYTCGSNVSGRLGRPITTGSSSYNPGVVNIDQKIKKIACGTNFTTCLSENGNLWSWGSNSKGQLGSIYLSRVTEYFDKPTLVKVLSPYPIHSFAVGDQHVVVLTDQGEVYVYGDNQYLQCGKGEVLNPDINLTRIKLETSIGPNSGTVFRVSAGGSNTMVSLSSEHHIFGEELLKNLNSSLFSDIRLTIIPETTTTNNDNNDNDNNIDFNNYISSHKVVLAARCEKINQLIKLQHQSASSCSIQLSQTKKLISKMVNGIMYLCFPISSITILNLFLKYLYSDHTILSSVHNGELGELSHCLGIDRLSYLCNFKHCKSLEKLPKSTLLEDFHILKNQEFLNEYSDIKFNCKSSSSNSNNIPIVDEASSGFCQNDEDIVSSYKLFAYIGSSYFKTMLSGGFIERDKKVIELFDTTSSSLKSLLNYCYCEEIPEDVNECIDMIIISDAHQIIRAKDSCAAKIRSLIDEDSICYIYHVSLLYNVKPLKIWCSSKFLNINNIKELPYFEQLPKEIQLELNEINIKRIQYRNSGKDDYGHHHHNNNNNKK